MAVALEKLLAVKAFDLGSKAAIRHSKDTALSMATAAIDALSPAEDVMIKVRLAFYHLVRAEILRHGGDPVADRDAALHLCESVGSPLYRLFMTIEEATTSRSRGPGHERLLSAYGAIAHSADADVPSSLSRTAWRDYALSCLDEDPGLLTEQERRFLNNATLNDMLRKHGIDYVP